MIAAKTRGGFGGQGKTDLELFVERLHRQQPALTQLQTVMKPPRLLPQGVAGGSGGKNTYPFLPRPPCRRRTIRLIPMLRFDDLLWSMNNYERSSRM